MSSRLLRIVCYEGVGVPTMVAAFAKEDIMKSVLALVALAVIGSSSVALAEDVLDVLDDPFDLRGYGLGTAEAVGAIDISGGNFPGNVGVDKAVQAGGIGQKGNVPGPGPALGKCTAGRGC
jgi:hypothetical protein